MDETDNTGNWSVQRSRSQKTFSKIHCKIDLDVSLVVLQLGQNEVVIKPKRKVKGQGTDQTKYDQKRQFLSTL